MLRVILIFLCNFFLAGCATVPHGNFEDRGVEGAVGKDMVVWMLSDIHPKTDNKRKTFEAAVADVNKNVGSVNMAVIAGDLLKSRSSASAFNWFMKTKNRSKVVDWFQIAGNHDVRSGPIFNDFFPISPYYSVQTGNLLFLCLSDISAASRTDISDEAFIWWEEMVKSNKDKIIVTVTHAQLEGSGLLGSIFNSRIIAKSKRFEEVLKRERVALWVSGHTHLPHHFSGAVNISEKLGGTCFLNVSSISDESFLDSESRMLYFKDGSDVVWIRSRNHSDKEFNTALDIPLSLGKKFVWAGERPRLL